MEFNRTKEVNKRLDRTYGRNLFNEPIFRVVFSEGLLEKRVGTFAEWYGKVFIREWTGLREVPKYGYIKAKYILERWQPPTRDTYDPLVPETAYGSYEPVYVFQDAKGNALPVNEEFIKILIFNLFHPALPGHRQSLERTRDETELKKEIQLFEDIIGNESPYLATKLHADRFGKAEGIVVPHNYKG